MKKIIWSIPIWVWLTVLVMAALAQVWLLRDTVMGDAFIHFVFARGIAEGQPFFYNGEFSAGSTSPLWSILLAPLWAWLGDGIVGGVKVLAGGFTALAVVLTFQLARKISANSKIALATAALVAGSFVLPFWAAKGMETPLYVCLVLGSFLIYWKILTLEKSGRWEVWLGVLLGLTILARPEGWLLAAFIGIPLLLRKRTRVIFSVGLTAAVFFVPYYFWLFQNTGQIFPSSIARILRARQWASEIGGVYFTTEILKILLTKLLPLTPFFVLFFWQRVKRDRFVFGPIYAWLGFHVIFFSFVMPTTEGYRYLLAALPFFFLLALLGVWKIKSRRWRGAALTLILVGSFGISGQQLFERINLIENCERPFIDQARRETGLWLRDHTPPTSLIALKEVDQSAYYSSRRVLSLDGTLDTRAIPFVRSGDQLGFLRQEKPNFFVLEEEMYREYPDWQNSNVLPLLDANPEIGDGQTLGATKFTLREKIKSGDATSCAHFSREYFWWIFEVNYAR